MMLADLRDHRFASFAATAETIAVRQGARSIAARVHAQTAGGICVETNVLLSPHERALVAVDGARALTASVAWASGNLYGLRLADSRDEAIVPNPAIFVSPAGPRETIVMALLRAGGLALAATIGGLSRRVRSGARNLPQT